MPAPGPFRDRNDMLLRKHDPLLSSPFEGPERGTVARMAPPEPDRQGRWKDRRGPPRPSPCKGEDRWGSFTAWMPGLGPGIGVVVAARQSWMAGAGPAMTEWKSACQPAATAWDHGTPTQPPPYRGRGPGRHRPSLLRHRGDGEGGHAASLIPQAMGVTLLNGLGAALVRSARRGRGAIPPSPSPGRMLGTPPGRSLRDPYDRHRHDRRTA
jgi:hypothetical protein